MAAERDGWERRRLGDVLELKRGYDLPTKERQPGDVPVVSSSGITGSHDAAKVPPPGVVIGRYGSIGEVHVVDVPFWPLNTALYVRDFKDNDPLWCAALLETLNYGAFDGKTSVPGVNRNHLHEIQVWRPPLPEQRTIVRVLGAFTDKAASNRRAHAATLAAANALADVLAVGADTVPLSTMARFDRRSVKPFESPTERFDHFSIPAFDAGRWPAADLGASIASHKFAVDGEAVLVSKLNPDIRRVWWVHAPTDERRRVASTEFVVLVPNDDVPASWLYAQLAAGDRYWTGVLPHTTGTTSSHQRVKPEQILGGMLPVLDGERTAQWLRVGRPMLELAERLHVECQHLSAVRAALLPRLIKGALRVPDTLDLEAVAEEYEAAGEEFVA